jgi:hypothetical protein
VAIRLNNLASVLQDQGDLAGARQRFERALAITEAALGPDHPSTRTIRDNLAALPPLEYQHSPPASLQSTVARSAPSTKSRAPARATALGEQQSLFGVRGAHPTPRSEENSMTENPGGPKYDFRGATVHGPIFNDAVFHEAVTLTHGLGAQPSQQAELAKALEALRAQLAALPAEKGAVANKAAESAKEVVEAAKPGGDESLCRGAVRSLRGWAEDIGKAVPAIGTAAEQVIKLTGQVRGWVA